MPHKKDPLSQHMEVFKIIPNEVQDILFDFYALWRKSRTITIELWQKEYGYITKPLQKEPDASFFQRDPVGYLIHASRSVRDFPDRLFKNLHVLLLKRGEPLTVKEFEEQVNYVYYEDAEKLPLTPKMAKVFRRGLLAFDPFTNRNQLAKKLQMTEDAIKWHIAEMKRRFWLYRLSEVDYYKLGLSRLFLFIKGIQDPNNASNEHFVKPLLCRYPLRAESFPTGLAKQYVSYQIHTPPWNRRYDFLRECKSQVKLADVDFLTSEPDLFLATGRRIYYNLRAFDFKTRRWTINLRDLRFLINNSLMTGSLGVFPPYDFIYDVARRQDKQDVIEFDELDLQICEKFWELIGQDNRFATAHSVSKDLNRPYREVNQRFKRLKAEKVIHFYFWSSLGLSTAFTTVLITKDEFILNNFQSIIAQLPVTSLTPLESLRDKEIRGVLCHTYLPSEIAIGSLFQSTFFAEEGVLGFCAQAFPVTRISRPLQEYYDPVRKWWKWDQLTRDSTYNIKEEYPENAYNPREEYVSYA